MSLNFSCGVNAADLRCSAVGTSDFDCLGTHSSSSSYAANTAYYRRLSDLGVTTTGSTEVILRGVNYARYSAREFVNNVNTSCMLNTGLYFNGSLQYVLNPRTLIGATPKVMYTLAGGSSVTLDKVYESSSQQYGNYKEGTRNIGYIMTGGGGGGGSGSRTNLFAYNNTGGGGGNGGNCAYGFISSVYFTSSYTASVGSGGTGGAGVSSRGTSGNDGSVGTHSRIIGTAGVITVCGGNGGNGGVYNNGSTSGTPNDNSSNVHTLGLATISSITGGSGAAGGGQLGTTGSGSSAGYLDCTFSTVTITACGGTNGAANSSGTNRASGGGGGAGMGANTSLSTGTGYGIGGRGTIGRSEDGTADGVSGNDGRLVFFY